MIKISSKRLKELKKNFNGKRIAIIGDMMLDIYYLGDVKRKMKYFVLAEQQTVH